MEITTLLIVFVSYLALSFVATKYMFKRKVTFIGQVLNAVIGLAVYAIIYAAMTL